MSPEPGEEGAGSLGPAIERLLRGGIWLLGLAGVALAAVEAGSLWSNWGAAGDTVGMPVSRLIPRALVTLTWGFGFAGLALAVAWRGRPERGVLAGGLFFGAFSTFFFGLPALLRMNPLEAPVPMLVGGAFTYAIGVRFSQLFPVPLDPLWVRTVGPGWFRKTGGRLLAFLLRPVVFWLGAAAMETVVHTVGTAPLGFAHVLTWATLGATYLWLGYRSAGQDDRRRIFWVMEAALVLLVIEVAQAGLFALDGLGLVRLDRAIWVNWLDVIESSAALGCLALAVFAAGAFDSSLVLRRTAVVSLSSGAALILFVALEETATELASDLIGIESRLGAVLSGVVAALVFQQISQRLDRRLGRGSDEGAGAAPDAS